MQFVGATKYETMSSDDVRTMRNANANAVYTLNDTYIPEEFKAVRQLYVNLDHVEQYTESALKVIRESNSLYYVLHDLPNIKEYGFGWAWKTAYWFSGWWERCAEAIKKEEPDILLGYPRLRRGYDIDIIQGCNHVFLEESRAAVEASDFISVDVSWTCGNEWTEMYDAIYYIVYIQSMYQRPIVVTYCNKNNNVKKEMKGEQYVKFLGELNNMDGIIGAFCHTLSSPVMHNKWVAWRTDKIESVIPSKIKTRTF